jgi:coenzyme PQQ synthesis protein D (PqqD)
MTERPTRAGDLEINEAADGYVVYDPARDRVHYLNHTAALVLELCTGGNEPAEIVQLLQRAYDLREPPRQETHHCLTQLWQEGLIS